MTNHIADSSELGKKSPYEHQYNPQKLFPISRRIRREELGLGDKLPFTGYDIWNHFEVSWLNPKGKPIAAIAEIIYSADSSHIIESKSMKLYFNSLNNTIFENVKTVEETVSRDLSARLNASMVHITITLIKDFKPQLLHTRFEGHSLDELDITCSQYHTDESTLFTESAEIVEETLCSDLLKSNCLVTNQPDWCSIQIHYQGKKINHEGLLKYLVSFRNDNEFHEQCIEKVFTHILKYCTPNTLTVYGRSTRRGGVDINAFRSTQNIPLRDIPNIRLCRQ